jgi:formate dehydrogenase major subunit/NADH-quinone oxidoreductase subunit G
VIVVIDDRQVPVDPAVPLLFAALDAGVWIPNLCAVRGRAPAGACRLCWVAIDGRPGPVPSCAVRPRDGMRVRTGTPEILALRRTAFELLMGAHAPSCRGCPALRTCEMIRIARRMRMPLRAKRLAVRLTGVAADERHRDIRIDPDRCVLCGRCIAECARARPQDPLLEFARRGCRTVLSTFAGEPLPEACSSCMRCVAVCPAAGLSRRACAAGAEGSAGT